MTAIEAKPRRWDPIVRLTHWSIVAAILVNALVTEEGSDAHMWVGYALAAILGLRLIWGVVGPANARFTAFPPSLPRAIAHIGDIAAGRQRDHPSHNPLGALMVYAIWATLGVVIASGIAMAGLPATPLGGFAPATTATVGVTAERGEGSEEGERDGDREEGPMAEVHEAAVYLLYALILLHIAGVAFESRRSGRRIMMAMLPGAR
ncbi:MULTISPECIES: cytochrome b/b6 domain-containing protein [Sphingomonas]|uniref:cytochrome b/b6 domain-containing protein n=1 Tax=Sphingomonas TaxID=13687 RepID=UPI00082CA75B|nr:cytochrome b/b6 domain-containing protein [Sphingomonas sp. CCH10-B3]